MQPFGAEEMEGAAGTWKRLRTRTLERGELKELEMGRK